MASDPVRVHPPFACPVCRAFWFPAKGAAQRDVNDPAASLFHHLACCAIRCIGRPQQIGVDHTLPAFTLFFATHFSDGMRLVNTGVVNEDINIEFADRFTQLV